MMMHHHHGAHGGRHNHVNEHKDGDALTDRGPALQWRHHRRPRSHQAGFSADSASGWFFLPCAIPAPRTVCVAEPATGASRVGPGAQDCVHMV